VRASVRVAARGVAAVAARVQRALLARVGVALKGKGKIVREKGRRCVHGIDAGGELVLDAAHVLRRRRCDECNEGRPRAGLVECLRKDAHAHLELEHVAQTRKCLAQCGRRRVHDEQRVAPARAGRAIVNEERVLGIDAGARVDIVRRNARVLRKHKVSKRAGTRRRRGARLEEGLVVETRWSTTGACRPRDPLPYSGARTDVLDSGYQPLLLQYAHAVRGAPRVFPSNAHELAFAASVAASEYAYCHGVQRICCHDQLRLVPPDAAEHFCVCRTRAR
jgi:hypothetical protein